MEPRQSTDCEASNKLCGGASIQQHPTSFAGRVCPQVAAEACFLQRMGNLTGLSVGCVSARPNVVPLDSLDPLLYAGFVVAGAAGGGRGYASAVEVNELTATKLNATVRYNDTTQVRWPSNGGAVEHRGP